MRQNYLDTSATTKLILTEDGSAEMHRWVRTHPDSVTSSELLRTELLRTVRRFRPEASTQATELIRSITLTTPTVSTYELAARLEPRSLRSLDALHLAAALELGDELEGIVTYDEQMVEAAGLLGIAVVTPA